jgi:glycosyltransferase involved in cell wall biosynthesis
LKLFRRQAQVQDRAHFVFQPQRAETALDALDCVWITGQTSLGVPTLLEAQARGIPVIATDLPCHRRYVSDYRTGLIVNVGHRAGFARQTLRLFDQPELASSLASAATEFALRTCDVTRVVEEYQRLYQRTRRGLR